MTPPCKATSKWQSQSLNSDLLDTRDFLLDEKEDIFDDSVETLNLCEEVKLIHKKQLKDTSREEIRMSSLRAALSSSRAAEESPWRKACCEPGDEDGWQEGAG